METKIAIQGIKGSFHHQVAKACFGDNLVLDECLSFTDLVKSLKNNTSEKAVMALENSIAGSIIPNYALIDTNDLQIIGEYYLGINMTLMALKGQSIMQISEVHSHPIALLQCAVFFSNYPHIKLVESVDTAETAQRIQSEQLKGIAAVASPIAATMYNLEILASDIHTIKNNTTRFVILQTTNLENSTIRSNKASLKFELEDKEGNLATLLNVMKDCGLNLTKIQSLPVIETPWTYSFFVDVTFEAYEAFAKAKAILALMTRNFKILGEYQNRRL